MFKFNADDSAHSTSFAADALSHFPRAKLPSEKRVKTRTTTLKYHISAGWCTPSHNSGTFNKSNHFLIRQCVHGGGGGGGAGVVWVHGMKGRALRVLRLITFFSRCLFLSANFNNLEHGRHWVTHLQRDPKNRRAANVSPQSSLFTQSDLLCQWND